MFLGFSCAFNKGEVALFDSQYKLMEIKEGESNHFHIYALKEIENLLCDHNISLNDIKGIIVNTGPSASFTGIRVSTVIAKTLAFVNGYPLFQVNSMNLMHEQWVQETRDKEDIFVACLNGFQNRVFLQAFYKEKIITSIQDVPLMEIESVLEEIWKSYDRKTKLIIMGDGIDHMNQNNSTLIYLDDFVFTDKIKEPSLRFLSEDMIEKVSFEDFLPQYYRAPQVQEDL